MISRGNQIGKAITVVEVCIIVAIVLIVIGLGLAALSNWWERANRLRCVKNLKVLGESIIVYQDKHQQLPPSRIDKQYATWAVLLAPYLPKQSAVELLNWEMTDTYYEQLKKVRQEQVWFFYCPARRAPPQNSIAGDVPSDGPLGAQLFSGALGDYACSSGNGATDWKSIEANGAIIPAEVKEENGEILEWTSLTDLKSLPRGQSPTILVGEKHVPWNHFGKVKYGDGSIYNGDYIDNFARVGGPGYGLATSMSSPLNNNFGSYHFEICNFLMGDGSVQPYSTSISEEVLGKMTNRN